MLSLRADGLKETRKEDTQRQLQELEAHQEEVQDLFQTPVTCPRPGGAQSMLARVHDEATDTAMPTSHSHGFPQSSKPYPGVGLRQNPLGRVHEGAKS